MERGTLLLRIDQRQLRNTLAQSKADLEVARARLANAKAQLRRSEKLFKAQSLSETGYDQSVLDQRQEAFGVEESRLGLFDGLHPRQRELVPEPGIVRG